MDKRSIRKWVWIAGVVASAVGANANMPQDGKVTLERAGDSQLLTVRYKSARATLVEFLINGTSIATRNVDGAKSAGETNFSIDASILRAGSNTVEVRLYDASGKLVGSQTTQIVAEPRRAGPVTVADPKPGASLQGAIEIKLDLSRALKSVYVSFFIDSEFQSLKNFPPYSYIWDTSRAANGWHELEAWVVDDANATYKSDKVKVFVNNPSGRTERRVVPVSVAPAPKPLVKPVSKPVLNPVSKPISKPVAMPKVKPVVADASLASGMGVSAPGRQAEASASVPTKPPIASGPRAVEPSGKLTPLELPKAKPPQVVRPKSPGQVKAPKVAPPAAVIVASVLKALSKPVAKPVSKPVSKPMTIAVVSGGKVPNLGSLQLYVNGTLLNTDVPARVEDGIALAPFRYLFEYEGGSVKWDHAGKTVLADGNGTSILIKIGSDTATVNGSSMMLDRSAFIDRSRTIVPLSFLRDAMKVDVQIDPSTKHVLITSAKK